MSWAEWCDTISELPEMIAFEEREARYARRFAPLTYDDVQAIREVARAALPNFSDRGMQLRASCVYQHRTNPQSLCINLHDDYGSGIGHVRCQHPDCEVNESWNRYMDRLGLDPLIPAENLPVSITPPAEPYRYKGHWKFQVDEWPDGKVWDRGYLGEPTVLSAFAFQAFDARFGFDDYGNEWAAFPCYDVDGEPYGHQDVLLSARWEGCKKADNCTGPWQRDSVLGALQMRRAFPEATSIVLVEGMPDALRLVDQGVPAVPSLGCAAWNDAKSSILAGLGFERIFVCMNTDANEQGQKGAANARLSLHRTGMEALIVEQPLDVDLCRMNDREVRNYIEENFR